MNPPAASSTPDPGPPARADAAAGVPRPGRPPADCRMLVVQWGGDYREAYRRLSSGGDETYHAQRYSVASIGEIGRGIEQAGVLCCFCDEGYDEVMGNGVRTMGTGLSGPGADFGPVLHLIERFRPTHLIATTPREDLIGGALRTTSPCSRCWPTPSRSSWRGCPLRGSSSGSGGNAGIVADWRGCSTTPTSAGWRTTTSTPAASS